MFYAISFRGMPISVIKRFTIFPKIFNLLYIAFISLMNNRIWHSSKFKLIGSYLVLSIFFSSCSITKNIPDGKYLLDKSSISVEEAEHSDINASDLETYVRQKPNKRILLFRFHLRMYNMANPTKYKGIHGWLKTIGEEPVILDTFQTELTTRNLKQFLENKGYYSSTVNDTTTFNGKRAKTSYMVSPGNPIKIRNVKYVIEDSAINSIVNADVENSIFKKGVRFDRDVLDEERKRIEANLKEKGYYFFSRDFITFTADTSIGGNKVDLVLNIRNRFIRNQFGDKIVQEYKKYEINKVFIYPSYDPVGFTKLQESNLLDTFNVENQFFVYAGDPGIKLQVLEKANLIKPGSIYSESVVTKTRNNFSSLRLFRMVNIFFETLGNGVQQERKEGDEFLFFSEQSMEQEVVNGKLNCFIQLAYHTLQSYQVDLVGTNSSSDFGAEVNLNYQHKNLFKGAEIFDMKFRGMLELIHQVSLSKYEPAIEVGGSIGLNFPRFLTPFSGREYITKYSPRTQVLASYNYQDRPDYTRTVAGLNFGYSWKNSGNVTHSIIPVEINLINLFKIDPDFLNRIQNTYLFNSYQNQLVSLSNYTYLFNNQVMKKNVDYTLLRYNIEFSGNILRGIYSAFAEKNPGEPYQLLGTDFSQYIKTELNYTYHQVMDKNNTFVYRVYGGLGYPYGNSKALPFEKKFFSGGSSGVRAWHARGLGPGTYIETGSEFLNQTADIKFEANVEYRFKLFWMLEGALFLDAGNIWAITAADERSGALFKFDSFYKQLALGTGTGIRLNLGFFTIRFDLGIKVHDPGIITSLNDQGEPIVNYHWIPFERGYKSSDFLIQIGIGYPF